MRIVSKTGQVRGGSFWASAVSAAALTLALSATLPGEAMAQEADRIWRDCVLSSEAVDELIASIEENSNLTGNVDFIVVYTLNENNGQQIEEGTDYTGPVICINGDQVGIDTDIDQNTSIPADATLATTVNSLDAEEAFALRYQLADGDNVGDIEKVFCHSVENNVDCVRIFPDAGEP